jgi:hypothetical protein
MADNNTGITTKETYEVNPAILNSSLGYSAKIGEDNIMVVANLYGEGYNAQNEKINIIKEKGFVLINGEKTASGKFERLTDEQLLQLVTAGVILLSEQQQADFRRKFFNVNKLESEKKK